MISALLRTFFTISILVVGNILLGQEICDNGIDDDGDGLVDIYDPDCACTGVDILADLTDYIPNPDFESMLCCPQTSNEMHCCEGWVQGSPASLDYMNACDFIPPSVVTAGLVPFPSGNGAVGGFYYEGWREYPGVCLKDPLQAGVEYTLAFQIGATVVGLNQCNDPFNMNYPPVNVTLFGNPNCNFPSPTTDCPTFGDPDWIELGYVSYLPVAAWNQIQITFTPSADMNGIIIGAPCVFPAGYEVSVCNAYIVYDDFTLFGGIELAEIELIELGLPCSSDYTLLASIMHQGGVWQWYFNGAALQGENDPEFLIANNNSQSGTYAVTYTIPEGCVMDSISIEIPLIDTMPAPPLLIGPNGGCLDDMLTFYLLSQGDVQPTGYEWFLPSGLQINLLNDSTLTYYLDDVGTVTLCGRTFNECGSSDTVCLEVITSLNDTFFIEGMTCDPNQAGVFESNHTNQFGCDSIVVNTITLSPSHNISFESTTCDSALAGVDTMVLSNQFGCDSIVVNTITLSPSHNITLESTTCDSALAGVDTMVFSNQFGCDSILITQINLLPSNQQYLISYTCNPQEAGLETLFLLNQYGCDSIITLDIRAMTPHAIIAPPLLLDCNPEAEVILDGSLSPVNPISSGTTTYEWTGPVDGFNSNLNAPLATVTKPGTYCLIITFENNGIICTDTACVTVMSSSALPAAPLLTGPNGGCPDDLLTFTLSSQGNVQPTGYEWFLPSGLQLNMINDSTLTYLLDTAGTIKLCGRTFNECGASDTICIDVITAFTDTFFLQGTTCDPNQVGVFDSSHLNQFGCDSIVVNTITLSPSHSIAVVSTTCDPAMAGVDTLILPNQYGCDSVTITQVNLLPSNHLNLIAYTCDSLAAGLDTLFLLNQHGCDSIVYIDRIFAGRFQEETFVQICGAGQPYIDSLNVIGGSCDSLFITHFSFIPLDTTFLNASTCDPSQVGTTVNILQAFSGCDSTIITLTALLPSDATTVQAFNCDLAQAGQQIFTLQNQYGCDSIVTLTTQYVGVDTQFVQLTTCDIQQSGSQILVFPGTYCDTIQVVETNYIPGSQNIETVLLCADGGPVSDTLFLTNFEGCDSLVIREFQYIFLEAEVEVVNERCLGQRDGEITVTSVTGSQPPLEYRLELSLWQSSPDFGSLSPGNYTVFVRDSRGCEDTLAGLVIAQGVNLVIEAGPDQLVEYGNQVPLNVTSSHPLDQVTWSAIDAIPCVTCPTTTVGPVYVEQVVNVIGVTADGCEAQDFLNLRVNALMEVFIPNSFSPDNNGINDIFSIYGNQFVRSVRNLNIYDRWGNALYARADLPINDPSEGWDGTFRGEPMDPGVYVYVVEVELTDGTVRLYKGDVTVVK